MANLGSLFYSLYLKDMTDDDIPKIKAKLEKELNIKIGVDVSEKAVDEVLNKLREKGKEITKNRVVQQETDKAEQTSRDIILKQLEREGRMWADIQAKKEKAMQPVNQALSYSRIQSAISLPYESASYQNAQNQLRAYYQEQERLAKSAQKVSEQAQKAQQTADNRRINDLIRITSAIQRAENAMQRLSLHSKIGGIAGPKTEQGIEQLRQYISMLERAKSSSAGMTNALNSIRSGSLTAAINQANRLATEQGRLNAEKNRALALETRHKAALDRTNASMRTQDGLVSSLRNQMANVYSIYTLERFATQLIEIGGEFQKQHIALQSILGDGAKADAMFSKIKNLAIESPFTFQQLAGYTKQLAAFQIPYEELYDTTKRLADVSAGLGVDMGRIILAYGQVRSAAFLRGQEVRQFTEAGIPLLDELAKKFSQLENRVVSVGEVFDKISNREVPFAMVKEVFTDLTNEGGKFYNMQAKLSDSLSGKLAKLKDAYQIMLADIAQANNDLLGGSVDMVRVLTEHWRELLPVLTGVIGAYGAYKTAILLVNAAQKANIAINSVQTIINASRALRGLTALTKAQAVAQGVLNAVMAANPLYLIATVIGVVIGSIVAYTMSIDDATDSLTEYNKKVQEQADKLYESKQKMSSYLDTLFNAKKAEDERRRAFSEMQNLYPSAFKNMTYEQALLRGEIALRKEATEIARMQAKVTAENNYRDSLKNLIEAEREMRYAEQRSAASDDSIMETDIVKEARENLERAKEIVKQSRNELYGVVKSNLAIEKEISSRWFTESTAIAGETGSLAPRQDEGREAYFKRIGEVIDDLNGKINALNKKSKQAQEVLPGYTSELSKAKKIYEDALGGAPRKEKGVDKSDPTAEKYKNEIALLKELYSEYKKYVDLQGKEKALNTVKSDSRFKALFDNGLDINNIGEYIKNNIIPKLNPNVKKQKEVIDSGLKLGVEIDTDGLKKDTAKVLKNIQKQIDDTTKKWDLFKSVREKTGNKKFAMQLAFGELNVGETDMMKGFREEIEKGIEGKGISFGDVLKMDEASMKDAGISSIEPYVKAYNDGMMQLRKDTADNLAELVSKYRDYATQVTEIENKLNDDLADIESNRHKLESGGVDVDKMIAERKKRANEEKGSVAFEQFKESSDWVRIFDDLDRVSNATLDSMIDKVEEFASSQKLSVEDTKELVEALRKLRNEQTERNPFKALGASFTNIKNAKNALKNAKTDEEKKDASNQLKSAEAEQAAAIQGVISKFDALADAADFLGGVFENLGLGSGLSDAASVVGSAVGGASTMQGITSALGAAGPWGAAAGAALGLISGIAQIHDKKLDKAIERSKQRVEELKNAYDNLNDSVERFGGTGTRAVEQQLALYEQLNEQVQRSGSSLSTSYSTVYEVLKNSGRYAENLKEQIKAGELTARKLSKFFGTNIKLFSVETDKEALKALEDVGVGGTEALKTYQAQYVSLVAQRRELEGQLRDEESKKKSDSGKIADYQQQINELNGQIRYFIEDLAKELYAIDFDDWAGQISDALTNAFANGEDAALAFDDAVNNIMKNVANSILKNLVIAPMMEKLQQKLFGDENGNGGVFKSFEDLNNNTELAASTIKDFFDTEGNAMLDASQKFLEAFDKATGGALAATGESDTSGLSKGIQGVTEDTADLLGSYLNSIRQDVSVKRMLQEKFFNEDFPKMSVIAQVQLQQLNAIARNTERNAQFAEEIRDMFNRIIDKGSGKLKGL
nr:MAG TPA: tail tape measure protein [Caudoviricetes sp.]